MPSRRAPLLASSGLTGTGARLAVAALAGAMLAGCGGAGGAGATTTRASATGTAGTSSSSGPTPDDALRERIAPSLDALLVPPFGTGAAITARTGAATATVARGALFDGGSAVGEGTRFNVASVSKMVTAARVVSLAHAGRLGLDDAIAMHLPGVALVDPAGTDRSAEVTIRQLVAHRSGVPHVPPDLEEKVGDAWSDPDLLQDLTASWTIELVGAPGEYRYANLGYALLAAIVEREGSCSFADCMQGYLEELGMQRSTFWPATLDDDAAHGRISPGGAASFHAPTWYGSRYAIPFGGLWTTMPELARFGDALVAAAKDPTAALSAMPGGDGTPLGAMRGERLGAPSLEHDGSAQGFYAALVVAPSREVVVALVTNGGNEAPGEVATFTEIVAGAVLATPAP